MKPKYRFFANARYALQGARDILRHERSFGIEVAIFALAFGGSMLCDLGAYERAALFASGLLLFIVEALNSAIERVVDLCSPGFNELAGAAKDAASFAVMLTIALCAVVWAVIFARYWGWIS